MRKKSLTSLRLLSRLAGYSIVLSAIGLGISFYHKGELPSHRQIDKSLYRQPEQLSTERTPFSFTYADKIYEITPVADYHISGLLVSHNDIRSFWDMYHDKNSVDIKDICLLWGSNLIDDTFKKVSFHNESVSCHFKTHDATSAENFNTAEVSNNHLLASDPEVRRKINESRVGDQVELSGMLINYCPRENRDWIRQTSLSRTDTGGGACEVMFVEEFQFLKKAPRFWYRTYEILRRALVVSVVVKILLFLLLPWLEYKYE